MTDSSSTRFIQRASLQSLLDTLREEGYTCVGPCEADGAIVYDKLDNCSQLPQGVSQQQSPGHYSLQKSDHPRYFTWANGPQAIKPYVFASRESLWRSEQGTDGSLRFVDMTSDPQPLALIGVRACDLAALFIQDKHFLQGDNKDPYYKARRQQLFLVAVNCTHPAQTCFCASTGDGPRADYGYDIVLSETDDGFLVHGRSDKGLSIIDKLPTVTATEAQIAAADEEIDRAATQQQRGLPSDNLRDALFANLEHARWDEVAARCLSCGNCTSVCPTCFCHAEQDVPSMDGKSSEYYRQWDSCFTQGHSYIHGITVRAATSQRYRQWLTHKLGSWHDQYGRSGCVGCGRCITWCPVGIDITEEAAAICGEQYNE